MELYSYEAKFYTGSDRWTLTNQTNPQYEFDRHTGDENLPGLCVTVAGSISWEHWRDVYRPKYKIPVAPGAPTRVEGVISEIAYLTLHGVDTGYMIPCIGIEFDYLAIDLALAPSASIKNGKRKLFPKGFDNGLGDSALATHITLSWKPSEGMHIPSFLEVRVPLASGKLPKQHYYAIDDCGDGEICVRAYEKNRFRRIGFLQPSKKQQRCCIQPVIIDESFW